MILKGLIHPLPEQVVQKRLVHLQTQKDCRGKTVVGFIIVVIMHNYQKKYRIY